METHIKDTFFVTDLGGERLLARIAKTSWGKFKIVGEDTYGKTVYELLERLEARL